MSNKCNFLAIFIKIKYLINFPANVQCDSCVTLPSFCLPFALHLRFLPKIQEEKA